GALCRYWRQNRLAGGSPWSSSSSHYLLAVAACTHEFVEHTVKCAESNRKMALSLFKMRQRSGKPRYKPLAVGERHHQISASLPDHGRDRDLVQADPPRPQYRQVIVEPPLPAGADRLAVAGGHVLGELAGKHTPVDVGQHRLERSGHVGGGDIFELFAVAEEIRPQLVFALERSRELDHVLLSHAGHPVEAARV